MNVKKSLVGLIVLAVMLGAMAVPAFAEPSVHTNFGQQLNASQGDTSGKPIVNITYKVVNDYDSGTAGNNWAVDNYTKKVQVWAQADGTYYAIVKYQGQFVTIAGASPQAATTGGTVVSGIKGTFEGGYQASFDGTFAPTLPTNGNLGTIDYATTSFDWVGAYFTGNNAFDQPYWAWNYHAGKNGSWVNASTGNLGDITGTNFCYWLLNSPPGRLGGLFLLARLGYNSSILSEVSPLLNSAAIMATESPVPLIIGRSPPSPPETTMWGSSVPASIDIFE